MRHFQMSILILFVLLGCKIKSGSTIQESKNSTVLSLDENKPFYIPDTNVESPSCDRNTVRVIGDMPIDHSNPSRGTFPYRYEYINDHPGATTVVFLPGGPGSKSIGDLEQRRKNFPGLNILLIDPRGVNCNNQGANFFLFKELRTEQHAQDILRVIQNNHLSNFIIYGISYGTLIGTVLASDAEKAGLSVKAVVLEGIMGKAFTAGNKQTFNVEFDAFVKDFPDAKNLLAASTLPLDYSEAQWGQVLKRLFVYSRKLAYRYLTAAASYPPGDPTRAQVKKAIDDLLNNSGYKGKNTFFAAVACKEIFDKTDATTFELQNGKMVEIPSRDPGLVETCMKVAVREFYDPARYQISAPIYYFQGSHDPACPPDQAMNHFQVQTNSSKKIWTAVLAGGHSPLNAVDQLAPCGQAIWSRIDQLKDFDGVINKQLGGTCVEGTGTMSLTGTSTDADQSIWDTDAIKAAQQ